MILSDTVKIKKIEAFDNSYIEAELKRLGKGPVRWALIDIDNDFLTVSVSYIN